MSRELETKELNELYKSATLELKGTCEKLIVWAGGDAVNQQDALTTAFQKRFPEVPIDIQVELSKIHDLRIYEGLLNGDLTPDVTMLQTSNDFEDWQNMGVLEAFTPEGFSQIKGEFKDPNGEFSAFRMFAFLPQFAREGLTSIPENLTNMLSKEYQNKLVLTYPHDDDAVLYVYEEMIKTKGEAFISELAKLNPFFIRGTAGPPLLVGRQGFLGTLTGYETTPEQPSKSFIPKNDFFISWAQRAAMFKLTKHKAAARLFLAFIQSEEYQEKLGNYTVRKDIVSKSAPWIGSYTNTNPLGFYAFMRDRKHIGDLRKMMISYFGSVQGESPVVDHKMIKLTYGSGTY